MSITWLREHNRVPWKQINRLVPTTDGMCMWPETAVIPLSFSLFAERDLNHRRSNF
uniref:Uncharacterized protein n=1 Tax=Rhizobium rhizogenes TaxID=359 RepID=A0A7S5DS63_RHIRH|nr:hypothetical protein pC6.5b_346 [Rhizobium rhizogenes]